MKSAAEKQNHLIAVIIVRRPMTVAQTAQPMMVTNWTSQNLYFALNVRACARQSVVKLEISLFERTPNMCGRFHQKHQLIYVSETSCRFDSLSLSIFPSAAASQSAQRTSPALSACDRSVFRFVLLIILTFRIIKITNAQTDATPISPV